MSNAFCTGTAPIMALEPLQRDDTPKLDIMERKMVDEICKVAPAPPGFPTFTSLTDRELA
jgi:hypothetical protein